MRYPRGYITLRRGRRSERKLLGLDALGMILKIKVKASRAQLYSDEEVSYGDVNHRPQARRIKQKIDV